MSKRTSILLVAILALAAALRFAALDRIPPGIYPDEAINGTNALSAWDAGHPRIFYPDNNGREGLFINIVGLSLKTFGVNQFGLRFPSALFGVLTVLGIFFLTRELFGKRAVIPAKAGIQDSGSRIESGMTNADRLAMLAAFFLAVSYWHLNFSRIAFRAIMVPLVLTWSFYFLLRAFHDSQNLKAISYKLKALLGGALFGLGFHTYIAFRIAPLLLAVFLLLQFLEMRGAIRGFFRSTVIALAAAALVAAPMGLYFLHHPDDFLKRGGAKIGVFEQAHPLKELARSVGKTALMFNFKGDCNWRHNLPCWPEVSPVISIFFLAGIFFVVRAVRTRRLDASAEIFLASWLTIFLLPEALTAEGIPHALRAIGAVVPAAMLTALGLDMSCQWLAAKKSARVAGIMLGILLGATALFTWWNYFVAFAHAPTAAEEFTQPYTHMAAYLVSLPVETKKYIIVNRGDVQVGDVSTHAHTIKLLLYPHPDVARAVTYIDPANLEKIPGTLAPGTALIPLKADEEILAKLISQGLNLRSETHNDFTAWVAR